MANWTERANQPSRIYLRISLKLGRLPYISRKVRKTRAASHIVPKIEAMSIAMLSSSSQMGNAPMLSFIIAATGAVNGKRVKMVKIKWLGFSMKRPMSIRGIIAGMTIIPVHWLLSLAVEPMDPRVAIKMPKRRYPRMK